MVTVIRKMTRENCYYGVKRVLKRKQGLFPSGKPNALFLEVTAALTNLERMKTSQINISSGKCLCYECLGRLSSVHANAYHQVLFQFFSVLENFLRHQSPGPLYLELLLCDILPVRSQELQHQGDDIPAAEVIGSQGGKEDLLGLIADLEGTSIQYSVKGTGDLVNA